MPLIIASDEGARDISPSLAEQLGKLSANYRLHVRRCGLNASFVIPHTSVATLDTLLNMLYSIGTYDYTFNISGGGMLELTELFVFLKIDEHFIDQHFARAAYLLDYKPTFKYGFARAIWTLYINGYKSTARSLCDFGRYLKKEDLDESQTMDDFFENIARNLSGRDDGFHD